MIWITFKSNCGLRAAFQPFNIWLHTNYITFKKKKTNTESFLYFHHNFLVIINLNERQLYLLKIYKYKKKIIGACSCYADDNKWETHIFFKRRVWHLSTVKHNLSQQRWKCVPSSSWWSSVCAQQGSDWALVDIFSFPPTFFSYHLEFCTSPSKD